jgi:ArsR family transcriptional regulator
MRHKGVLLNRRDGVNIFYRISNQKVVQACMLMKEVLAEQMRSNRKLIEEVSDHA